MSRFIDGPPGLKARGSGAPAAATPPANDDQAPVDHLAARRKWSPRMRDVFAHWKPQAICLVATDGPVSITLYQPGGEVRRRIGHNRGFWPARFSKSKAWTDTVTQHWNKFPELYLGTQARLWFRTDAEREKVLPALIDMLEKAANCADGVEGLPHGFVDIGVKADLTLRELEMSAAASLAGVKCWDDTGLTLFLADVAAAYTQIVSGPRVSSRDPIDEALGRLLS